MDRDKTRQAICAALNRHGEPSSDFDLNQTLQTRSSQSLRDAAVLVPLLWVAGAAHVVLTKRASHLSQHPGQIAFPGGKIDESDASPTAAALREAHEEIGLAPDAVEVLGALPDHETVTHYRMSPIVGWIDAPFDPVLEPGEVAEVFRVPLAHLATPENYLIEGRQWLGQRRRYYAVPYGPYYIWGATARILRGLADRILA